MSKMDWLARVSSRGRRQLRRPRQRKSQPKPSVTLDVDAVESLNDKTSSELQRFMDLLREFEQATMKRLVAISNMKAQPTATNEVLWQQAEKKFNETGQAVMNAFAMKLGIIRALEANIAIQDASPLTHDLTVDARSQR
jgi:hypothetical protein